MGTNQHLVRSVLAIMKQGGVALDSQTSIMPDPILVGRNEEKLKKLAEEYSVKKWSTDLESCLADPYYKIYFDAQATSLRPDALRLAAKAGKDIYCEKPIADNLQESLDVARDVMATGVKNGVVQDKLWLPGLIKLKRKIDEGFFGRIFSIKGEFGYWVFDGKKVPAQRPSWNYRKEDGGGLVVDMLCHFRYVIDNLFGEIESVSCTTDTQIKERLDENGKPYVCTADDAAFATFQLKNGAICQINSSWNTRVKRDDLFTLQVDGTKASAVAGLTKCWVQTGENTPRFIWNPDEDDGTIYDSGWEEIYKEESFENAFKIQWELFLKHVCNNEEFRWNLAEGSKGIQLAERALESNQNRAWVDLENIEDLLSVSKAQLS